MTTQYPVPTSHPSLALHVTEPQRDRALAYLQAAYADGRLTATELDERVGQALVACNRAELNAAFSGLVTIPLSSMAVGAHPAYAPVLNQHRDGRTGKFTATLAHSSALVSSFVGPAFMYAVTKKDTYANLEAAKAFNFQVLMLGLMIAGGMLLDWAPIIQAPVMVLLGLSWLILTIVGALRASNGDDWVNPLSRVVPLRILEDRAPHQRGRRR